MKMERVDRANKQPESKVDVRRRERRVNQAKIEMAGKMILDGVIDNPAFRRDLERVARHVIVD